MIESFFSDLFLAPNMEYFALFVIIALGYIVGRISVKGISLDISAIIFVAMLFGHLGVKLPTIIQNIGLVMFIFTIGIQAGPGFFDAIKKDGIKLAVLAVTMALVAGGTALVCSYIWGLDMDTSAGLLAGAMTSTPGLATATEIFDKGAASIGYGIAYPFGVIGIILMLRMLPKVFRVDMAKEEQQWEKEALADYPDIEFKHLKVENEQVCGKTIGELNISRLTEAVVSRVKHGEQSFAPTAQSMLSKGDLLRVVGTEKALERAIALIGPETAEEIELNHNYDVRTVLVTNKKVVNKSLAELNLRTNYDATVTRIRRSGIDIIPSPSAKLHFADKLVVACDKDNLPEVEMLFGNEAKSLDKNDFLPIALGIVLGVILGKMTPLGLTGGVLFVALILGRIGKTGPILWTMTGSANSIIRELGLILFLGVVGTEAGATIVEKVQEFGFSMFVAGALITIMPMLIGVFLCIKVFKMNFVTILGALSGSMTSTPGLAAITPMTRTNAPQLAYATIYPFAMVALVVIIRLMYSLI